ncbi:hypothetical protein BDV26DRAFT_282049 [Aspergillus bertholletiae]|uniref:Uncharacterized protein n=1 Tax=Aspergillus bertholletiae TaxID=1226010 RepID=A0A5N7B5L9_9EURO|nr:hypothetical protein BDV26DRAFT_282049 [Aspergillus bertholletiae]
MNECPYTLLPATPIVTPLGVGASYTPTYTPMGVLRVVPSSEMMEVAPSQAAGPRQYAPPLTESCVASENLSKQPTMVAAAHATVVTRALPYGGPVQLLSLAIEQHNALTSRRTEKQILLFQPVSLKEFIVLLDHIKHYHRILKLDYNCLSELLVVKVMPGWDHEYTIALFRKAINKQLAAMYLDDEYLTLASPLMALHDGSKEPDTCWIPTSSPRRPTCVVEVGTSESQARLATDARRWLESSNFGIQTVITVCFKYLQAETDESPLTVSIWSLLHQQYNMTTRNPYLRVKQTATLNIYRKNGSLSVSGSQLDPLTLVETETDKIYIPLKSLIGRPPVNPGERDVILTKEAVLKIFEQLLQSRLEL